MSDVKKLFTIEISLAEGVELKLEMDISAHQGFGEKTTEWSRALPDKIKEMGDEYLDLLIEDFQAHLVQKSMEN